MCSILGWLFFGLICGSLAKALHPGEDPVGFLPTALIGIAGSVVGGLINWILGFGHEPYTPSGILMGTVGGIICCWIYRKYRIDQFLKAQGRLPENLIHEKDEE